MVSLATAKPLRHAVQLAIDCVVLLLALFVVPLAVFYSVLAAVVMGVFCGSATGRGGMWAVDASALGLVAWRCYQRVLPKEKAL